MAIKFPSNCSKTNPVAWGQWQTVGLVYVDCLKNHKDSIHHRSIQTTQNKTYANRCMTTTLLAWSQQFPTPSSVDSKDGGHLISLQLPVIIYIPHGRWHRMLNMHLCLAGAISSPGSSDGEVSTSVVQADHQPSEAHYQHQSFFSTEGIMDSNEHG